MKYTGYYSIVNVDDDVIMNRPRNLISPRFGPTLVMVPLFPVCILTVYLIARLFS
jgi:hypothetical protein